MVTKPKATKSKSKDGAEGKEEKTVLLSCAELLVKAETKENEAKEMEKEASQKLVSTLPRQFGQALSSRLGKGDKESVKKLLRDMDKNGDGQVQNIELRQMIRNHLKIKATNAEIDDLFNSIDTDGSGQIDYKEMTEACHKLLEEANDAKEEMEAVLDDAARKKERAARYREAAAAMQLVEEEQKIVDAVLSEPVAVPTGAKASSGSGSKAKRGSSVAKLFSTPASALKSIAKKAASDSVSQSFVKREKAAPMTRRERREQELRRAFAVFDTDGSGALDHDEIKAIFTRPGGGNPFSDAEVEALINEFDANHDGVLQFEEFSAMWESELAGAEDEEEAAAPEEAKPAAAPAEVEAAAPAAAQDAAPGAAPTVGSKRSLESRVGAALLQQRVKIGDVASRWDPQKKGSLSKAELVKRLHEMGVAADAKEVDALFEALVNGQAVSPTKGEVDVKRLVKLMFEWVSTEQEYQKNLTLKLTSLRSAAKKLQSKISSEEDMSFAKAKSADQQAQQAAEQEAARLAEEKAAKEAKRKEEAARKEEEKKAFDAKIEAKRKQDAERAAALAGLQGEAIW